MESTPRDGQYRGDDAGDFGKGMLHAEDEDQEQRNAIIWEEERWHVVFVTLVERPDVGREEISEGM